MPSSKPHAALVSSPGMGHLGPVIELGKLLATQHEFDVTIIVVATNTSAAEEQVIQTTAALKLLEIILVPPVDISALVNSSSTMVTKLSVMMRESLPSIRSAIISSAIKPSVLIVDFFGTDSLVIGDELDIPKFVFVLPTAWFLALTIYTPYLDKVVVGEYVDQLEPLTLPGCKSVRPEDVVDPMLDRSDQQYHEYVQMGQQIVKCDGVLVNTWDELESTTIESLRNDKIMSRVLMSRPIYPIGPLIRPTGLYKCNAVLFDWLDSKPDESVLYVSFGSGGTLSAEQMNEVAYGLELSQQNFIWVARAPVQDSAYGSFFSSGSDANNPSNYLTEGFLTRTEGKGMVMSSWAPQREILNHKAIGGFLSHCGWNSTLESMVEGVPMIAWPLYAEQRINATLLTEEIGVAVRPEVLPAKKLVTREEISKMVTSVMGREGNMVRERAKNVQKSAQNAMGKGGSSYRSLALFVEASLKH